MRTVLATTKGLAGNAVLHHAERVPLRLGAFVRTLERVKVTSSYARNSTTVVVIVL